MTESLGKAVLDLEANLAPFEKNMKAAKDKADDMQRGLDALAAVSKIATEQLQKIRMKADQAAETAGVSDKVKRSLAGISTEAERARADIERVKLGAAQAVETEASGDRIDRKLRDVTGNANEARRALESVRLAGFGAGGAGGGAGTGNRNPGAGFGPFGSGFGRVGVLGAAIGGGALLAPAAGPAALGALAAIPALSAAGIGSLGALALAFQGVGKAISGDKKAYDDLVPAQQKFVLTVRSLDGALDKLKQTAAGAMFPGLTEALKSALSPGTLGAVTTAVQEFGRAIGQAGAQWGRYFGSTEFQSLFGPLMASGARTVGTMSSALLHLFDALGVLGRAGIPLTTWLTNTIADGARFVDTWLHAKDATGQLSRALDEAKTSMQLVGNLFGALLRAVGALGEALYPVSKIAVKDLTDGLNALAGIIQRNQDKIREIVGGALSALVATVKTAAPIVAKLAHALGDVVDAVGGWKTAFEIVIGGFLALKFLRLGESVAGAVTQIKDMRIAMLGLGAPEVLVALAAAAAALALIKDYRSHNTLGHTAGPGGLPQEVFEQNGHYYKRVANGRAVVTTEITAAQAGALTGAPINKAAGMANRSAGFSSSTLGPSDINALLRSAGATPREAAFLTAISGREDSSGSVSALNDNPKTGDYSVGLFQMNYFGKMRAGRTARWGSPEQLRENPMLQAKAALDLLRSSGPSQWTTNTPEIQALLGGSSTWPGTTPPPFTKNLGPKPPKPAIVTGANLLSEALRNALQNAKDKVTTSQGSVAGHWLRVELDDLEKARKQLEDQRAGASGKKKAAIQAEIRSIDGQIAAVNKGITTNLREQATAIKEAFKPQIASAKSNILAAFQTLKATLDAQFQAATQTYIETVLGPKFFQGTDAHGMPLQTPLEKQLAGMQSADTKQGLQDALDAAKKQLVLDQATVDITQEQLAADRKAIDQAGRAIDENDLAIRTAAERAQADHDYAEAVKQYQADRAELERKMNLQLDMFARGLADGTTKLSDLGGIVEGFGLSLTADGGIVDDFAVLGNAVQDLAWVLREEAKKLLALGDIKDAGSIIDRITDLGGLPAGADAIHGGGTPSVWLRGKVIPMAAGGIGRVKMPTLFFSRGDEDFAFSGEGRSFGDLSGGRPVVLNVSGFVGNEAELGLQIARLLQRANLSGTTLGIR